MKELKQNWSQERQQDRWLSWAWFLWICRV